MYNVTRFQRARKIKDNTLGIKDVYDFGKIQFMGTFINLTEAQFAINAEPKKLAKDEYTEDRYAFIVIEAVEEGLFVPESYRELYMFNGIRYNKIDDKELSRYTGFCYH